MDNSDIQLVGGPCGQHGPYTFYKAFKYKKNGVQRMVTLSEFFFVKLWIDSDLLCIGELQLLWSDKNSEQVLASLRLYFLPENTPEGRMDHGEDEVLAISEKVVLRVEDLITWITVDAEWTWGRLARCEKEIKDPPKSEECKNGFTSLSESSLDFSDVEKERKLTDCNQNHEGPLVVILSYPRYCRYRAMMRRLEGVESDYLKYRIVNALGGFTACTQNTRVLFCKDTFDYPELEGHELLCNHLAPKLKGRPRGKRKKRSVSPGSESNESESSLSNVFNIAKDKITAEGGHKNNGIRCDGTSLRRSTRSVENSEGKEFLKELAAFMKANYTPIGKIPSLGYKELDLFSFYNKVQKLGGYDAVTTNRLWKSIFDDMSGHANSTSAATVVRRHYERFLLPYERHIKGEEYKPLPISERRRLKSKTGGSASDADTSESTSRSGNSTPIPQMPQTSNQVSPVPPTTPTSPTENKEFNIEIKPEAKPSSLRSVRVKPERQKEKQNSDNNLSNTQIEEEIIKTEVPAEEADKPEPSSETVKPETVKIEPAPITPEAIVPEKDAEPLTSAVAPVAQKLEKSRSPVEGKENIPIIQTGEVPGVVEVPYKPKSPEVIDLEPQSFGTKLHQPYLQEVKKRKLDILKEGGLEVTPVRTFTPKDIRPSVIQPTGAQVCKAKSEMPPPSPKKIQISVPQSLNISKVEVPPLNKTPPKSYAFVNGGGPPKVLQSKSIYSYSEKTIYGNPKDYIAPPPVHTPKFVGSRPSGDILDLTVTSPQKPVVEIMKIPSVSSTPQVFSSRTPFNRPIPPPPMLDGRRLGSNLEITLINNKNAAPPQPQKYNLPATSYNNSRHSHKRPSTDFYTNHKMSRVEENGKYMKPPALPQMPPPRENKNRDMSIPHSFVPRSAPLKPEATKMHPPPLPVVPHSKHYPPTSLSPFPYLSHLYDNKGIPPYLPMLDPYYSAALNSLYSHAVPPVTPFPSSEQLKFYTELIAHNSRLNFSYPLNSDGNNPSLHNFKKP